MLPYKTKAKKLAGTNYREVRNNANVIYNIIKKKTKRQPYIRSAYWKKEKVFLNYFWKHTFEKNPPDRFRRLKYFAAAIELVLYSRHKPVSKPNPNKKNEIVHRFAGQVKEGDIFYVQIKENKNTKRKYFMSCFPPE